jgi:hypothetical protein
MHVLENLHMAGTMREPKRHFVVLDVGSSRYCWWVSQVNREDPNMSLVPLATVRVAPGPRTVRRAGFGHPGCHEHFTSCDGEHCSQRAQVRRNIDLMRGYPVFIDVGPDGHISPLVRKYFGIIHRKLQGDCTRFGTRRHLGFRPHAHFRQSAWPLDPY